MFKKGTIPAFILTLGMALLLQGCGKVTPSNPPNGQNQNSVPANVNDSNSNANINASNVNVEAQKEVVYAGKVFVKGYKTPSESYGIITDDGIEIGLGSYDSMKEEFRPYVGDQVTVTFTSICKSGAASCCRTIFPYCGTVKSWKPVSAK